MRRTICRILPLMFGVLAWGAERRESYDVVVIGATPAGAAAAIAAGRAGLRVALVEETPVPGGLLSNGVSRADDNVVESVSGVFEDFRRRIADYYLTNFPNDPVVAAHRTKPPARHGVAQGRAWEPKVAAAIYRAMLAAAPSVEVFYREAPVAAVVEGEQVRGVVTSDARGRRRTYHGRVVIDATYEGDVAKFAGASYRLGREPRSTEEPHAGHIFTDAFCEGAYALRGAIFPGGTREGDHRIMAYNYRFVVKDYGRPEGPHRLKAPPPGYDPLRYKWRSGQKPILPNGKTDVLGINWGNDWAGPNYAFPEAGWEERAKIAARYRDYALGFLYYIQNEGGDPNLGLAEDEFTDNGNFPYRLYVREARRIDGTYTLTESDIHKDLRGDGRRGPLNRDAVAIGIYEIDSHNVQNPTDRNSRCSGEGAVNLLYVTGPYQIPYGVMVPAAREGLLVPVAISATHVALSSVRMEPVWSALGEAAGEAAVLALRGGARLRDVSVPALQGALLARGCKLFYYADVDAATPGFADIQRMSLLGAADGDDQYRLHPGEPITLGELARLAVKGLDMPLSITAAHFQDAGRGTPDFKYIETLYDAATESGARFLPFEVRDKLAYAHPDRPVPAGSFARILAGALFHRRTLSAEAAGRLADSLLRKEKLDGSATVSRAAACRMMAAARREAGLL